MCAVFDNRSRALFRVGRAAIFVILKPLGDTPISIHLGPKLPQLFQGATTVRGPVSRAVDYNLNPSRRIWRGKARI